MKKIQLQQMSFSHGQTIHNTGLLYSNNTGVQNHEKTDEDHGAAKRQPSHV